MKRVIDQKKNNEIDITSYIAYISSEEDRLNSTSGGMFYALAQYWLLDGGLVYGVAFDEHYIPCHICVDKISDLHQLQGSKYPQSKLGDVFDKIKRDLLSGRKVLFSGTPCQVAGLKKFLVQTYDNLFTIDLICHGVPSPGIWAKYLSAYFDAKRIKKIVFKNKSNGWKAWRVYIETQRGLYQKERGDDAYMASYLNRWNVRPSCYECHFKGYSNRFSDITIADAWGEAEQLSLNDNRGLSAVIINTNKGNELFNAIKANITFVRFPFEKIVAGNAAYNLSIKPHFMRNKLIKKTFKNIHYIKVFSNNRLFGRLINRIDRIMK